MTGLKPLYKGIDETVNQAKWDSTKHLEKANKWNRCPWIEQKLTKILQDAMLLTGAMTTLLDDDKPFKWMAPV